MLQIIELAQQAVILSILWYAIARFFYLKHARKIALELLDDEEYIEKSEHNLHYQIQGVLTEHSDNIISQLSDTIDQIFAHVENVETAIKAMDFSWDDEIAQHFISMLNGWYGNLHKNVEKQAAVEDVQIRDAVSYAQMNNGNPAALDMIQQALAAKSPLLAAGMELMKAAQGGNNSRSTNDRRGY